MILVGFVLYVVPNDWNPVFLFPALALSWIGLAGLITSFFRKGSFRA